MVFSGQDEQGTRPKAWMLFIFMDALSDLVKTLIHLAFTLSNAK